MLTRFICLANSYKHGGRCIAGIELNENNEPLRRITSRPKWIRPVTTFSDHGQIPADEVKGFKILDVLEVEITERRPEQYQSENFFYQPPFKKVGIWNKTQLDSYCDHSKYIFGTRYPSINEEVISELNHSLMLIKTSRFEVVDKVFEDNPDKIHKRLIFEYNNHSYDFSITDPHFLESYMANKALLFNIHELFLCVSLGIKYEKTNRYYKLIAGIIF